LNATRQTQRKIIPTGDGDNVTAADDALDFPLARISRAVQQGDVSAEALVDAAIARIGSVNSKINAVVQTTFDAAQERAREADHARSANQFWGPLHGIPMTIKDSLDTAGVISTGGTVGRKNFVPDRDATVVSSLRRAGAILVGKTNTPELTLSYQTNNAIYGRTSNPYDLARTAGGSSGGAAAIVATGAVPFDLGSDTGGSLRIPSHYCGVAALKPTEGRVSRTGHIIPPGGHLDRLTTIGPIARFTEDLDLITRLIAAPDGLDPSVVAMSWGDPSSVELRSLRVAFYFDNGVASPSADTVETTRAAADALRDVVQQIDEATPPRARDASRLFADLYAADGGAWRRRLLVAAGTLDTAAAPPGSAQGLAPDQFSALMERWDRFRDEMLQFLDRYDVLLCPVTADPAPLHGEGNASSFSYTQAFSLTGWPCVVVRCGTSGPLPIGLQIVARPRREDVALRVAAYLEAIVGGWRKAAVLQ
jgi:amidase